MELSHIENICHMYNKDIVVCLNLGTTENRYIVLNYKGKVTFPDNNVSNIQQHCRDLLRTEFIKLDKICMDIIGQKVYVDKDIEVVVSRIDGTTDGAFITTTSGRTYSTDSLWIKK